MNIYVQMEISVRELEGRLLLALAAAERGHRVLLGDVRPYLRFDPDAIPPGVYHDKSLTPSSQKRALFRAITDRGFVLTSQDEEHWLALPSYDVPARRRFSAETLGLATRSFAWGPHEARALASHYPDVAPGRATASGAPRADLWRSEFARYHLEQPLSALGGRRDYILVSSNFSVALDVNPFWIRMRDKRHHFDGPEDHFEFDRYPHAARKLVVLGEFVRAVRRLAVAHPEVLVVVRPHPIEARGAWGDLLGTTPNVVITRERTLATWVRGARAVIQNECTSAFEAAVSGVPVISFHPDGLFADHPPNALGRRASDQPELAALVAEAIALDESGRRDWMPTQGRDLLADRIAALDGPLAVDRIVEAWSEAWEESHGRGPVRPWDERRILAVRRGLRTREGLVRSGRRARELVHTLRSSVGTEERPTGAFEVAHKFPPLEQSSVSELHAGLGRALGRFSGVTTRVIAPDLVAVLPDGRTTGPSHGGAGA